MKGTLKYFEPDQETGYKGNWVIQMDTGNPFNNVFTICDETMRWIEENNPPKEIYVEFTVFCDCHYYEETNTAKHGLVAKMININ
jgi:hypothetical protein